MIWPLAAEERLMPSAKRAGVFAPAFNICVNRLLSEPTVGLCRLSLCRKLFRASTKYCVATATVAKSFVVAASNRVEAESSLHAAEMSTVSVALGGEGEAWISVPIAATGSRPVGALTGKMSMI